MYLNVKNELDRVISIIEKNMERYGLDFPSACATNSIYRIKKNDDWTNGFWTGMLWIAYEYTKKEKFKNLALENIKSFKERLENHFVLDHHDIGFLYSLSVYAGYKILNDNSLKQIVINAADVLMSRFQEKGGFIQAWGKMGEDNEYRLIIDSLLNLPLLYRAYELTNNKEYFDKAETHYNQVINNIFRDDFSTYHTFYFDKETGKPSYGATHQGFSDQSCWARGQAWAILGMPLHSRISKQPFTEKEKTIYKNVVKYFEEHTTENELPYWDLIFNIGSNQPKDSSALAIVACAMIELNEIEKAKNMIYILKEKASSEKEPKSEGLILHGVYAYAQGKGIDEPNLWGDYFYTEALYRILNPDWETYW